LVEAHGGTLRIQSAPGAGTTATVRFPSAADQPRPAAATSSAVVEALAESQ
jgi:hypothetical protein